MKKISWPAVTVITIAIASTALLGSYYTDIGEWYQSLIKPSFQPPDWLFAPVWTILYILIGISAGLVYHSRAKNRDRILELFAFNLILNVLWSFLYFNQQKPSLAIFVLLVIWMSILALIVSSARFSRPAAWLLLPYILWVSFAALLNYFIIILNPII